MFVRTVPLSPYKRNTAFRKIQFQLKTERGGLYSVSVVGLYRDEDSVYTNYTDRNFTPHKVSVLHHSFN
jgi:hypothetical protein